MGDAEGASVLGMAVLGLVVGLELVVVVVMLPLGLIVWFVEVAVGLAVSLVVAVGLAVRLVIATVGVTDESIIMAIDGLIVGFFIIPHTSMGTLKHA
jgi:hypothetical protein